MTIYNAPEPKNGTAEAVKEQRILDTLWLCALGGIIGEIIGMGIGRLCLAVWIMWAFLVIGVCAALLLRFQKQIPGIATIGSALLRCFKRLPLLLPKFKHKLLSQELFKQRLSRYYRQRRWIAAENILRRFLAENPGIASLTFVQNVYSVYQKTACSRQQFSFLIWFILGGGLFTFISCRLFLLQNQFSELLTKAFSIPAGYLNIVSNGLLVALWFILIAGTLAVFLLLQHKQMKRWGSGWAMIACLMVILFPAMQYGLTQLLAMSAVKESPVLPKVLPTVISSLPTVQYWFIAAAMLCFCYNIAANVIDNNDKTGAFPPLLLFGCGVLLMFAAKMPYGLYLPETLCFCTLLTATGLCKVQWRWLLIPFCGFLAAILNLTSDSFWIYCCTAGASLFISGFLITAEKDFYSLFSLGLWTVCVLAVCSLLRKYCGDDSSSVSALLGIWSAVNVWQVLPNTERFDARFCITDIIRKKLLRIRYRNTGFGSDSLIQTPWYQNNNTVTKK